MFGRISAIATNTFREAVRDRVLLGVSLVAIGVIAFCYALSELSLDQQSRVFHDMATASISLFSVVVAVFLGSSLLYKEIERKTLYVILPKPIRRSEFLIGKYLGIVLTCVTFVLTVAGILFWLTTLRETEPKATTIFIVPAVALALIGLFFWKFRDRTILIPLIALTMTVVAYGVASSMYVDLRPHIAALALNIGEIVVIAAIAMLFSAFSTPFLTGLLTMGIWLIGRSADEMEKMRSVAIPEEVREMLHGLAKVVPNLNLFVPGQQVLTTYTTNGVLLAEVSTTLAYGVLYAGVLLTLATVVFGRRDLL